MNELLQVLKALGDETRLKLVKLLLEHDYCVSAIAKKLCLSEPSVSQHLKVLRHAGLIKGDKRGYYTHYYVEQSMLTKAIEALTILNNTVPVHKKCLKEGSDDSCCKKDGSV